MAISDTDQHIPFINIVADGVTSIDTFNTWRKKTNGTIKVINDGLITRYIADRAITPPKLSQGGPYWDLDGDFHTNGNDIRLGHARSGNINTYIGSDRSGEGASSLFFQTARASGGSGSGANTASIVRNSGASAALNIANSSGQININVDTGAVTNFNVANALIANFNANGLAVVNEITSKNVKTKDIRPYYRLTSEENGALSWNIESSGSRFYIRTGITPITTTLSLAGTNFTRSGTSPGNVVVVNAPNHGYPTGSVATISGMPSEKADFHGTYTITNVNANTFSYVTSTSGALTGSGTANISMVIVPVTPLQILNDTSVIVGGRTTSTARSGDEFTVLGDSYLSGSLTVTGIDTAIGHSIGASTASLSIGINRTENGSSAVKFYSSKTANASETASITRDTTNLIIDNTGTGNILYRQGTNGSHKFQISNGTSQVDRLVINSAGKVTIPGTLEVTGGFVNTTIVSSQSANRLINAFGDGFGNQDGTNYGDSQTYFKLGTSVEDDYFLIVGGTRGDGNAGRTGIVIRSHEGNWTPHINGTNQYNTDGLFIEKGSGLNGNAVIYNSGTGTFEITNRGTGNILFRTSPDGSTVTRLTINGTTGAATFANTVTSTRFHGPLTGNVKGNLDGKANTAGIADEARSVQTNNDIQGLGIRIDDNIINVTGHLDINKARMNGTNAVTKQNTVIYNGANTEIVKFEGSSLETNFAGNVIIAPSKLLKIDPVEAGNNNRARLRIGDWYIGQSSAANGSGVKNLYISTSDTATISNPRLLIDPTTGLITGRITNADTSAVCTGNAASVTNGVYTVGDQRGNNAIDGIKAFKKVVLLSNAGIMFDSDASENTGFTWSSENAINVQIDGTTRGTFKSTGWNGKVVGDVTGNVKGNVEGNVKGDVQGFLTGSISGSSTSCTGNAATVTDGMYLSNNQTVTGVKRFTQKVVLSDAGIVFDSDASENTGFTWSTENVINVQLGGSIRGTFRDTGWNGNVVGDVTGNVTGGVTGYLTGDSSGSSGSCRGNAATATNLSTDRTNWVTNKTLSAVVGQLGWRHYGNNHTIFDASNSKSPSNTTVNNKDADVAWTGTYPTLMGWNGTSTYGVRVDSARVSDSCSGNAATATTAGYATNAGNSATTNKLDTAGLVTNGNQINPGSSGELALTYQNANGGTSSFYDTTIFDGKRREIARFSGSNGLQRNIGDIVINNSNPTLYLQDTDHRSAMVHVNSNIFYILRAPVNSTAWAQEGLAWPLEINLNNNWATFGGNITSNGVIRATNDIIAFTSSDKNLKSHIKKIKDPLEKIAQLSGNTFKWNSKKQDVYEGEDVGVIAQEVEEIIPSAVITREDGTKAVRYEKIIPLLIESIKELHALNSTLLGRIEQLEKQLK